METLRQSAKANKLARMAKKRKRTPKSILKLPDLEQSKSAVLNSLPSVSSQRSYDHAIRQFIDWYCSEPRLAFNRIVVTRYRIFLEQAHYASSTINLRLAAVSTFGLRGRRFGLTQPGPRRRHTPCEGREEARNPGWQLAHAGTGPGPPFELRSRGTPWQARLRHGCRPTRMWIATGRVGCGPSRRPTATRRTLGIRRPDREGWSH